MAHHHFCGLLNHKNETVGPRTEEHGVAEVGPEVTDELGKLPLNTDANESLACPTR